VCSSDLASVGDHDLVAGVAQSLGLERSFYKVAMRPGKPLMAGRFGPRAMVGLPGNPVSAMVCGRLFVVPMVEAMLGLPDQPDRLKRAPLAIALPPNGPRAHYMRARIDAGKVTPFASQDSALLRILSDANALIIRAPNAPASEAGDLVDVIRL